MKRTEQVNSIATQSITPRRKRRASKKKSATLTRADVNLIVNRKFAQTLEKKFFDATFAFSAGTAAGQFPSSDGWIEDLSDMTQGVGITQRVRIAPTSLEFRWLIFPNAAGLITGLFFRMVIFIWTADGTPTIGDILTSGTTPFENLISPLRTIRRRIGRYYLIKLYCYSIRLVAL